MFAPLPKFLPLLFRERLWDMMTTVSMTRLPVIVPERVSAVNPGASLLVVSAIKTSAAFLVLS